MAIMETQNMIATIDITIQSANPSMPLFPMRAFEGSPSSIRIRNVPKKIGNWNITRVFFSVLYPDGSIRSMECVKSGGLYVGTVEGCDTLGKVKMGYSVFAYGIDEYGEPVENYCLGKGDVQILDASGLDHPIPKATFVKLCEGEPEFPKDGDMWQDEDGKWYMYQDGEAQVIGDESGRIDELEEELQSAESALYDLSLVVDEKAAQSDLSALADVVDTKASTSDLTDGTLEVKKSTGSTTAERLVNSLSDEHSTRVVVDEHDNVIVQKYVQSGWYVDHVAVVEGGEYIPTTDYWVTVDAKTTNDGLEFTCHAQDYAMTLPAKETSWTVSDPSITETNWAASWYPTETGGASILINVYLAYSATPIWVNVSRLVPDGSKQSGLKASQIAADGTFLTPTQVEPYGVSGFAKKAIGSGQLLGYPYASAEVPNLLCRIYQIDGDVIQQKTTYAPWSLSMYNGTTFDPAIEMKFGYYSTVAIRVGHRIRTIYLNSYGWLGGQYWIPAEANESSIYLPTGFAYITDTSYTVLPITLSSDDLSIDAVDGQTGVITCTRTSYSPSYTNRHLAFEDELESKADASDLSALATVVSSKADASDLALKQDALNATQLSAVNSGIDSNKVNAIEDWKFPSVTKQVVPQEPLWEYDIDQTQWIVASDPVYIDVNVWRMEVVPVQSGTTFYAYATGPEYPNTLEFSSDNPQMSFTATTTWYQSVVCDMYKVNQMVVSDSNRSLSLVGILNETDNRRGDLWLVVDATNLPNDIPFVCGFYQHSFFPFNDSEDFNITSGKTNIFHIEETEPKHFVVEKTIQAMDKIGYAPKLKLGEEAKWLPQGFHWGLTETLAQDMTYSASYTSQDQYGRYWWVGQYEIMPNAAWDWSVICFDPSEGTLDGWRRDMEEELPANLSDLLAVLGTFTHVRLDLSTVSWNDP